MPRLIDFRYFALALLSPAAFSCAHHAAAGTPDTTSNMSAPAPKKPQLTSTADSAATTTSTSAEDAQGRQDLDKALKALSQVEVFFSFNEDTLTPEAKSKLDSVADVLTKHAVLKVKIDGNADERGTDEYNLILGQKRADSAKKYLVNLGVKPEQIATLSYGKERPRDPGHDEKAWQENRRDDVVATPPTQ
jgi:peptidoglycan-associated lipoprotein